MFRKLYLCCDYNDYAVFILFVTLFGKFNFYSQSYNLKKKTFNKRPTFPLSIYHRNDL